MKTADRRFAADVDMRRGRVGRRIFSDPEIYRLELERIFARCWLYLAHESQLADPGDYVMVNMGEESVIVCRARGGAINAFLNTCRHRGNKVCRTDMGNASAFVCPYHGWTYDTSGALTGVPGAKEYFHNRLDQSAAGLPPVAQVASYKGLIFGTFDGDAPPLEEYLGDMRWGLDLLLDQGELVAVPVVARWTMQSNWKFAADNAVGDMYHGLITHRSAFMVGHAGSNGSVANEGPPRPHQRPGFTLVTTYGHGLNADEIMEGRFDRESPLAAWRKDPEIQRKLGPLRKNVNRSNMNVFPNLFVNSGSRELMLRNPLGPTSLEIWKTVLVDKNSSPELQRLQVRNSNRHFGPAGMFEQDDGENWDQSTAGTRGAVSQRYDLMYEMAIGEGTVVEDDLGPPRINSVTNEHAQLWMYHCWAEFMDADSWPALRNNHSVPRGAL